MNRKKLRLIIVFTSILIGGITIAQFTFLNAAYRFQQESNNQNIKAALARTWRQLVNDDKSSAKQTEYPVQQLSEKYFVVNINKPVQKDSLKAILKREFEQLSIATDFQFAIYNPIKKKLELGDYIKSDGTETDANPVAHLPTYTYSNYYFCVYFPYKAWYVVRNMGLWIFFALLLIGSIGFFGYAMYFMFKQSRLSKMQKDFINSMTHEFQTPISTISMSAEALKNPEMIEAKERVMRYATVIGEEALRLKTQVETVLQVERIDKNNSLNKQLIDLHDLIVKAGNKVDISTAGIQKSLTYNLSSSQSIIYADPLHIYNVIYNILDNALKYSISHPEVTISTFNEQNKIVVSVKDNGIGIEPTELKKIFNKFYRVSGSKSKGFGIGLYYVKTIVKAHGGTITVTSKPGNGSTFSIYLPLSSN